MILLNSSYFLKIGMTLVLVGFASPAFGVADEETAKTLTKIFRSARAVVADNIKSMQTNPKDAGLDMAGIQKAVDRKYLEATGIKIDITNEATKNLKDSIDTVFTKAFADGFKETWAASKHYPNKLLPFRFAREIGQKLKATSSGKYEVRLTVTDDCLINPKNKADDWERKIMNEMIATKGWEKNKGYFEVQGGDQRCIIFTSFWAFDSFVLSLQ